jgi:tryptophan synthase beta subunit
VPPGALVLVNLSGRGDKDVHSVLRARGRDAAPPP